jgi:MYXO-CTERM domain-containing protein
MGRHVLAVALVVAPLLHGAPAEAYAVHRSAGGAVAHWPASTLSLELDPSVTTAIADAREAAIQAAAAWDRVEVGPLVSVSLASAPSQPAVDRRNVVYCIADYPAAQGALAVTLLTWDEVTGEIEDADVVLDCTVPFALLPADARAAAGATLVANEADVAPSPGTDSGLTGAAAVVPTAPGVPFDLVHVLAHETGHVLGLADVEDRPEDVMFLYSARGDAERRAPTADDVAGVAFLYPSSDRAGCGVAGAPTHGDPFALVLLVALGAERARRRRRPRIAQLPDEPAVAEPPPEVSPPWQ